ncbi:charged multivesicular body protein 5-like [Gossypium australe]|uniref:Charged multivesicular body protein 5-like n=1 Tax=Gossypium australe TaxID=47621 RepID=A0A5B6UJY2_9ROSI|nr:charged multivesicular body protein 5-like [Gossypium australe]
MKRAFGVKKDKEPPPSIQDASDRIVKWKRVATLFQASSFMLLFQTGTQEFSPDGHFIVSADRDFKIRERVLLRNQKSN